MDYHEEFPVWCNILRLMSFVLPGQWSATKQGAPQKVTHIPHEVQSVWSGSVVERQSNHLVLCNQEFPWTRFPHATAVWFGFSHWRRLVVYTQAKGRKEHVCWLGDNSWSVLESWAESDFLGIVRTSEISPGSAQCEQNGSRCRRRKAH